MKILSINNTNNINPSFGKIIGKDYLPKNIKKAFDENPDYQKLADIWDKQGLDMHVSYSNGCYAGYFFEKFEFSNGEDFGMAIFKDKDRHSLVEQMKKFSIDNVPKSVVDFSQQQNNEKQTFLKKIKNFFKK